MKWIRAKLASILDMINISSLAFYVALKVTRDWKKKIIKLLQPSYIEKLLDWHGMLKAKTSKTPMQEIALLLYEKPVSSNKKSKYITKIKFLIYTIVETQIDIVFAMTIINCFAKNLGPNHFSAVNQILRYLASNLERGIPFEGESELNLVGYSDSDWTGDYSNKKWISGFVFTFNECNVMKSNEQSRDGSNPIRTIS